MSICIKCGANLPDGSKFCNRCGAKQELRCPSCNALLPEGSSFCNMCGTQLFKSEPQRLSGLEHISGEQMAQISAILKEEFTAAAHKTEQPPQPVYTPPAPDLRPMPSAECTASPEAEEPPAEDIPAEETAPVREIPGIKVMQEQLDEIYILLHEISDRQSSMADRQSAMEDAQREAAAAAEELRRQVEDAENARLEAAAAAAAEETAFPEETAPEAVLPEEHDSSEEAEEAHSEDAPAEAVESSSEEAPPEQEPVEEEPSGDAAAGEEAPEEEALPRENEDAPEEEDSAGGDAPEKDNPEESSFRREQLDQIMAFMKEFTAKSKQSGSDVPHMDAEVVDPMAALFHEFSAPAGEEVEETSSTSEDGSEVFAPVEDPTSIHEMEVDEAEVPFAPVQAKEEDFPPEVPTVDRVASGEFSIKGRDSKVRLVEYKNEYQLDILLKLNDEPLPETDPMHFLYGDSTVFKNETTVPGLEHLHAYLSLEQGFIFANDTGLYYLSAETGNTHLLVNSGKIFTLMEENGGVFALECINMEQIASNEHRDTFGCTYEEWHDVYRIDVNRYAFDIEEYA